MLGKTLVLGCVCVFFESHLLVQFRDAEFLSKRPPAFLLRFPFTLHGLDFTYQLQVPCGVYFSRSEFVLVEFSKKLDLYFRFIIGDFYVVAVVSKKLWFSNNLSLAHAVLNILAWGDATLESSFLSLNPGTGSDYSASLSLVRVGIVTMVVLKTEKGNGYNSA